MHSWNAPAGRRQADRLRIRSAAFAPVRSAAAWLVLAERSPIYLKDQGEALESLMGRRGRHLLTRQGDRSCDICQNQKRTQNDHRR